MSVWLDLLGGGIILLSARFIGEIGVHKLKHQAEIEEELIEFVKYIRDQIKNYKRPLAEIVSSFSGTVLSAYGFLKAIVENTPEVCSEKLPIDENCKKALSLFLRELGKSYCDEQIVLCDEFLFQMSNMLEKAKDEYQGKIKMYRTLPVLAAVSLIIILI